MKLTHDDVEMNLVDWYLHRVYEELNGPLTDDIEPIATITRVNSR